MLVLLSPFNQNIVRPLWALFIFLCCGTGLSLSHYEVPKHLTSYWFGGELTLSKEWTQKELLKTVHISQSEFEYLLIEAVPVHLREDFQRILRPTLILAQKYHLDPFWALGVMWTESHFKGNSLSVAGAQGVMQIMPDTRKWLLAHIKFHPRPELSLEYPDNISRTRTPGINSYISEQVQLWDHIECGVYFLKSLQKYFKGNKTHATVAYNMGPAWVTKRLEQGLPVGLKNDYLDKVISYTAKLRAPYQRRVQKLPLALVPIQNLADHHSELKKSQRPWMKLNREFEQFLKMAYTPMVTNRLGDTVVDTKKRSRNKSSGLAWQASRMQSAAPAARRRTSVLGPGHWREKAAASSKFGEHSPVSSISVF